MNRGDGWGKGVFVFLCLSIFMLGIGRVELPLPGLRFSAWSVSRTAFGFWLIWKSITWIRDRGSLMDWASKLPVAVPIFFMIVTISLLPGFRNAGDYRYFVFGVLHYVMIYDVFSTRKRMRVLFLLLALPPGMLVLRGVLHDSSVLDLNQMVRFGYPLDHPNTAGYLFAMSIPLAIGVIATERGWLRVLAAVSLSWQSLGLALTYSRGAWFGSAASILSYGLIVKKYKHVLFVIVFGSSVVFVSPSIQQRLLSLANPHQDVAINDRIRFQTDSFELGLEHPVLGIGYGRGRLKEALTSLYKGTKNENDPIWHAHNVYIDLFAGTGLLGLGCFLWLLGECMYKISRQILWDQDPPRRILAISILMALMAFVITGLGDVPFYHHETRIFFFTIVALAHLHVRKSLILGKCHAKGTQIPRQSNSPLL
jgi:putative inorganic carbon (HCO3(-)) transporter